jgi:transcriptional regulator with GAF, ATPase, and Fis domain
VKWNFEHRPAEAAASPESVQRGTVADTETLRERIGAVERDEIVRAIEVAGGNLSKAARTLGITRNGLALKMRRLGIRR